MLPLRHDPDAFTRPTPGGWNAAAALGWLLVLAALAGCSQTARDHYYAARAARFYPSGHVHAVAIGAAHAD